METKATPSTEVTLFKNRLPNCAVILADGKKIMFVNHRFFTTDREVETKLRKCAETKEFGIYIDANDGKIDPNAASPMEVLRKKHIEEFLAAEKLKTKSSEYSSGGTEGLQNTSVNTQSSEVTGGKAPPPTNSSQAKLAAALANAVKTN